MILSCSHISKAFGTDQILSEVSFHIEDQEKAAIVGINGAGKSTILKTISGGLAPMGGELVLDGVPMERIPRKERARKLAVVFTEKLQGELMTCRDVTAAGRYPYTGRLGLLSEKDQRAVDQALELVHGTDLGDRPFDRISDGQRQRIMLARALCQEPEMILLDEPTSHLDVKYKLEFLSLLREMARKKELSVIMSLHELDLAERISDRVVCIKDGRMDRCGTPEQVFTPGYVEGLFGMSGLTTGASLYTSLFEVPFAAKAGVTPIITDIPTATDAAIFRFIFLFLFIIPASFLNYHGLLITGYFASLVCAFAFFPRNPMDVLQINLSNIMNIAGNTRSTTTILIMAPLASNVQIEPIIST